MWAVPGSWSYSLSTKAFWDNCVAKYGAQCLKAPKMLTLTMFSGDQDDPYPYPRSASARWVNDFVPLPAHPESLRNVARQLQARRLKYKRMRPWFADTYAMWQMTPWSIMSCRTGLSRLKDSLLIRKNDRHEADAQRLAEVWTFPLQIMFSHEGILLHHTPGKFTNTINEVSVTLWFWRALGFLLMAALPARGERTTPIKQPARSSVNPWTLQNAMGLRNSQKEMAETIIKRAYDQRWRYPEFNVPSRHCHENPDRVRMLRNGFISLAEMTFDQAMIFCIEPAGLSQAFRDECDNLRAQLEDDRDNDYASWLNFGFEMPPYPGRTQNDTVLGLLEIRADASRGWIERNPAPEEQVRERFHGEDVNGFVGNEPLPTFALNSIAGSTRIHGERPHRHQIPYFTIAELYDYADKIGDALVLVEEGFDLDVYRRSARGGLGCASEPKLAQLLASVPGGDPSRKLLQEGYNVAEIRESLKPWRVGIIARKPAQIADPHSIRTFTTRSLRRHEFKETGMYVSIEGKVYNITDYAELHPGGLRVLAENAGRDVTSLFKDHHKDNYNLILERLQEFYIGNLVGLRYELQEDGLGELNNKGLVLPHEIRYGRHIYSVKALQESDEYEKYSELVEMLTPYLGTDATQPLKAETDDDGPLIQFARLRGYIVATIEKPAGNFPEIEPGELRKFDGKGDELEGWQNDSFVASNGMVYDLTGKVSPRIWLSVGGNDEA
ncbi:hypothetical protein EsH8_VIII_000105 [Colletotrichum jinshuiense]